MRFQPVEAIAESHCPGLFSAEEHFLSLYGLAYNASVSYMLALDEGTTSARAVLYDERGYRLALHAVPFATNYPRPGWVEQDADEIWQGQIEAAREVVGGARGPISGLGIKNQRETTIVWDRRTGKPVAPAIVWQCRRTADFCRELDRTHG